ncbi:HelD family protein [Brachybacterium sacelli]|uniref:DNA helicase IV n=1 Tax=Brachybacterium sacelli TaxID=173364 RepID=A0ABS4WVK3_9MICO|nr:AAA family ATPase [Brachybacterium sacelli]MBP2380233.1 DNA helicase IV [Brachybacterium sacelli]
MPETGRPARTPQNADQPASGQPGSDDQPADRPTADHLAAEQQHVDRAYAQLDAELAQLGERQEAALGQVAEDGVALNERDAEVRRLGARRKALQHAEHGAVFGRLDREDGLRLHIGPAGIREGDQRLVIDWRAPAAEPFYTATARAPQGLRRRRHLAIEDRAVVHVDDDLFGDVDGAEGPDGAEGVAGEGALLRALSRSRDGRMHEAVATLQAEQDAIVRAPRSGVLVVQGAPGTGKTVVALHRAAYLLYSAPEVLRRGVLVIGPSARFLHYIGDVLPALGETNVVTSTIAGLLPGLDDVGPAAPEVARLLGEASMAEILDAFLTSLQGASEPAGHTLVWDGDELLIPRESIERATERARTQHRHHNDAREVFVEILLGELTALVAEADAALLADVESGFEAEVGRLDASLEKDPDALGPRQDEEDRAGQEALTEAQLRAELAADDAVAEAFDALWPCLTPEGAVTRMLREGLDETTAPQLSPAQRSLLAGTAEEPWTSAHVPLLDEAAELLGEDDADDAAAAETARRRRVDHARRVIASTPDLAGLVSAEELAERSAEADTRDLATRALADRTWVYGHVIIDEAQELTPMQWRMLARRCPVKSMTVVGDIAQTSADLDTTTWPERLAALRATPRVEELSICYRSPRELVAAVEPLLRVLRPDARRLDAVRATGNLPVIADGDLDEDEQITAWARRERGEGRGALLTPDVPRVLAVLEESGIDASADDLRARLVVLAPEAAKGLEFDHVLVHCPDRIVEQRGLATLYVALTRATATLAVVQRGSIDVDLGGSWARGSLVGQSG